MYHVSEDDCRRTTEIVSLCLLPSELDDLAAGGVNMTYEPLRHTYNNLIVKTNLLTPQTILQSTELPRMSIQYILIVEARNRCYQQHLLLCFCFSEEILIPYFISRINFVLLLMIVVDSNKRGDLLQSVVVPRVLSARHQMTATLL